MPYSLDHKSHTAPPPTTQPSSPTLDHFVLIPTHTAAPQYSASNPPSLSTCQEVPHSHPSPPTKPPFNSPRYVSTVTTPSLVSQTRGKGKMKWVDDEDDHIPLAKLKKSRYEDPVYLDSLSQLELAAYALTQLQHTAPSIGPVQDFMEQPLHRFQGQLSGFLPHPMAFAPETIAIIS
ncbi:hypothetical protein FH972_017139 [Carpinus fangiana]|uniref:Uncharacterized protein n=1 Tax=Carpinus fangiana TaxID=176857 RepID=A0A5N6RK31_9ROSI|nr:hypothetical protein FH972_017139 [Carpinus fangiana]